MLLIKNLLILSAYLVGLILLPLSVFGAVDTVTIGASGADYTSLQDAETAHQQNLVTNDKSIVFKIIGEWTSADVGITVDGWDSTDATHFITITATGDARHNGVWDTTAYRIVTSYEPCAIKEDYTVVDGLQIELEGTADYRKAVWLYGGTVKNCIVRNTNTSELGIIGIYVGSDDVGTYVYNNIVYDFNNKGIEVNTITDSMGFVYNNTIVDCSTGVYTNYQDCIMINNIIYNCPITTSGTFISASYNATDTSALTGSNNQLSISDPFNDYSGDDFTLASGSVDCVDDGTDGSSVVTEEDDIQGEDRGATWDIGADEWVSESGQVMRIITGATITGAIIE